MADVMRLKYAATEIDFSPRPGYEAPEERRRSIHKTLDGTLYVYEHYSKESYAIPLNNISKADADNMNGWWQSRYSLTFYPDYSVNPGTTVTVKIMNDTAPFQMMFATGWQAKYEGTLLLREA